MFDISKVFMYTTPMKKGKGKGDNPCFWCGVDLENPKFFIHAFSGPGPHDGIVGAEEEIPEGATDLGWYPIGSGCRSNYAPGTVMRIAS